MTSWRRPKQYGTASTRIHYAPSTRSHGNGSRMGVMAIIVVPNPSTTGPAPIRRNSIMIREKPQGNGVYPPKIGRSINFADYIFNKQLQKEDTSLSPAQRAAIKKIEEYWTNRIHNARNWKRQDHFSGKIEVITCRVGQQIYKQWQGKQPSKFLRNFIRAFINSVDTRRDFMAYLETQTQADMTAFCRDRTDFLDRLVEEFPYTFSTKVLNIEKELLFYYFTFKTTYSVSWALRSALIQDRTYGFHAPLEKDDVSPILLCMEDDF